MPLFGKKKEKVDDQKMKEIFAQVDEILKNSPAQPAEEKDQPKPAEPQKPADAVEERVDRPTFAPLFVKIDRYRQILNTLGYLKTAMIMIKNSFVTLNELERARLETSSLIKEALEKIDKKISALDTELIRPAGFHDTAQSEKLEYQDVETVEATVADLKGQIDQLKAELDRMT